MKTFAINFTDLTGHFWNMDWEPATAKKKNLSDADVQAVVHYIKTRNWPANTSTAAKNCFDTLAAEIANLIMEYADSSNEHFNEITAMIERLHKENKLSKKGNKLFDRCVEVSNAPMSADRTLDMARILRKIIKSENLFAVKFADDRDWPVKVVEKMKCCICGSSITDRTSHNPYPVRPESWYGEKVNRCCSHCNSRIVIPVRYLYGRKSQDHHIFMKMNYEELLDYIA